MLVLSVIIMKKLSSRMSNDSDDASFSASSLSSNSVRLEDATAPDGLDVNVNVNVNVNTGNCNSATSFDISTVSLDKPSDDELDIELGATSPPSTLQDFSPPKQEALFLQEVQALRWRRVAVTLAFVVSMAATGIGSFLYFNDTLPEPDQTWLYPVILVAIYLLPVMVVLWYDYRCRHVINALRKTATNNAAIVNSLFPANVRSRMLRAESRRFQKQRRHRKKKKQRGDDSSRGGGDSLRKDDNGSQCQRTLDGTGSLMGRLSLGSREKRSKRRKLRKNLRHHRGGTDKEGVDETFPGGSPANQTLVTVSTETTAGTTSVTGSTHTDDNDEALLPKDILTNKPIADYFPHCTVLFADIVGFTAWSSVRDPTAVFTLLESLYSCFDGIARQLGVFKVETIGDCYVAVTGLPEPMKDHASIMAQFARACMSKMSRIVRALEKYLGPDTAELSMRFGLHSGPVTAGVMRGEKSRFQLFGDTVNTAARMESTGMRDRIHLSAETANELILGGKQNWVQLRDTKVEAKGKGQLQTYWLALSPPTDNNNNNNKMDSRAFRGNSSSTSLNLLGRQSSDEYEVPESYKVPRSFGGGVNGLVAMFEKVEKQNTLGDRTRRQADYTVKLLTGILKKIVAHRRGTNGVSVTPTPIELELFASQEKALLSQLQSTTPLKELGDSIDFASFVGVQNSPTVTAADKVQLPKPVLDQLEDFVTTIASMYQSHAFHCWEHASHVTISLTKLYSRLASATKPSIEQSIPSHQKGNRRTKTKEPKGIINDPSFGILNDPLTEFALVFAAMIHDVDHPGISNAKVIKEGSDIAKKYGKKSPLEQHSMESAWAVFQRPAFQDLRRHIYSTEIEMKRFRQLIVTLVMATDIMDRDAAREREKRWDLVFSSKKNKNEADAINQRATLVLETMMQVANIAHCTQHWNVFTKWNKRLFEEMSLAYSKGKQMGQKDPADFWYQGEILFFDETVIPMCTRLNESGAFGDDAEEFVNCAKSNRQAWQTKGHDMVDQYLCDVGGGTNNAKQSWNNSISSVSLWSSEEPGKARSQRQLGKPAAVSAGTPQKSTVNGVPRWPPPPKPPS